MTLFLSPTWKILSLRATVSWIGSSTVNLRPLHVLFLSLAGIPVSRPSSSSSLSQLTSFLFQPDIPWVSLLWSGLGGIWGSSIHIRCISHWPVIAICLPVSSRGTANIPRSETSTSVLLLWCPEGCGQIYEGLSILSMGRWEEDYARHAMFADIGAWWQSSVDTF